MTNAENLCKDTELIARLIDLCCRQFEECKKCPLKKLQPNCTNKIKPLKEWLESEVKE